MANGLRKWVQEKWVDIGTKRKDVHMLLVVDLKEKKEKVIQNVFLLQKQEECQKVKEDQQLKEKEPLVIQDLNQLMFRQSRNVKE